MIKMIKVGRYVLIGLLIWSAIDIAQYLNDYPNIVTCLALECESPLEMLTNKLIQFFYTFAIYMFSTAIDMFIDLSKK